MTFDVSSQVQDAIEWAIRVVSSLGFFLPIAIFAIVNLLSRKDKAKSSTARRPPEQPATATPQVEPWQRQPEVNPFPFGQPAWMGMEQAPPPPAASPSRTGFDRDAAYRHEDSSLEWGSAFAANDAEKAGSAFRWGSIFDDRREQTKWGWDDTEWGGDYAQKRDSEPKITVG